MVKAGALGGAHVKSWDGTWSSPDFQKAHRGGLVLKLRPLVTVAGVSQIVLGVRMAEWLRPGLWEVLMLSRGIEPGPVLTFNNPTGGGWY